MSKEEVLLPKLRKDYAKNPKDLDVALKYATALSDMKKFKQAEKILNKLSGIFPENGRVDYGLGYNEGLQRNDKKALEYLHRAIEKGYIEHFVYHNIGLTYRLLGELNSALKYFDKVLEMKPDFEDTIFHKGALYFFMEKFDLSLNLIDKVIEINPKNGAYYAMRALIYARTNRFAEFLEDIHKAQEYFDDLTEEQKKQIPLMVIFVALQGVKVPPEEYKMWIKLAEEREKEFNPMEKEIFKKGQQILT